MTYTNDILSAVRILYNIYGCLFNKNENFPGWTGFTLLNEGEVNFGGEEYLKQKRQYSILGIIMTKVDKLMWEMQKTDVGPWTKIVKLREEFDKILQRCTKYEYKSKSEFPIYQKLE